MHKTAKVRGLSKRKLKESLPAVGWMGLRYRGKKFFLTSQAKLLQSYLQNPGLSQKSLVSIRDLLNGLGLSTKTPKRVVVKYDCPELGTIYTPCMEKSCSYWGDFRSSLNCAACYMKMQGRNTLTVAEMGIFSSFSRSHINSILVSALTKLRRSALRSMGSELFGAEATIPSLTEFTCCQCHKETKIPPGYFGSPGDPELYTYCSFECWAKSPSTMTFISRSTGGDPIAVLSHLPRCYQSIEEAAKCLTISPEKLEILIWSFDPTNNLVQDRDPPEINPRVQGKKFWERQLDHWRSHQQKFEVVKDGN